MGLESLVEGVYEGGCEGPFSGEGSGPFHECQRPISEPLEASLGVEGIFMDPLGLPGGQRAISTPGLKAFFNPLGPLYKDCGAI